MKKKPVLVGLDPGGARAFGWCVLDDGPQLPLRVRGTGVANNASEALAAVDEVVADDAVVGAGIDAPMFWSAGGDRGVDTYVRRVICGLGASSGTVGHVNSLRGACVVQGVVAAMLLRQRNPSVRLTEAHPKAVLWMLGEATKRRRVRSIAAKALGKYFDQGTNRLASDHQRDAALGAISAWAMCHGASGWENVRARYPELELSGRALAPVELVEYWVPTIPRDHV